MARKIELSYDSILSCSQADKSELKIGVAVSGGRDSVVLLHCLKNLAELSLNELPRLSIFAVNVEHGIRGDESLRDSEFVKLLCQNWDIPLYSYSVDAVDFAKRNGYTLEQAGRILRYQIFDSLIEDGKCDLIALAHHLDDQVETVLMRILRGTGIRGLIGMKKANGSYIRPLLDYDRESIDAYVKDNGLEYVEDATNEDTAYTRNYLRKEIAQLKLRYPNLAQAVQRLSASAAEADVYIQCNLPKIEVKEGVSYIKTSDCGNKLIAKRLIFEAASALGVTQDIEDRHYSLVLDLLNAESGKRLMLTHGLCVYKEGDCLAFTVKKGEQSCFEQDFCEGDFSNLGIRVHRVEKSEVMFGGDTLYIDADKIPDGAVIRGRRDGDYIRKFGGGTKSLGDFLTDKKIPSRLRGELKIIAEGSRVYAVFGVDISSDARVDENTKNVYALETYKSK